MIRPVDVLLEFLAAEQARGVSHILLDDGARDGLRGLFHLTKSGTAPPAVIAEPPPPAEIPAPAPATLTVTGATRSEQLDSLRRQAENWPPARSLGTLRDILVFATGDPDARVMFVGEAPGYQEEIAREPFVGPAGQKLNDILKAMGLSREEVYLTTIVKFRPAIAKQSTNNRTPDPAEIAACLPFLRAEIDIVKPTCIVALGGTAAEGLLGLTGAVPTLRGPWHDFLGTPVRVTFHPSYLLQSSGASPVKRQVWEDMLAVMEHLGLPISEKQRGFFLPRP